MLDFKNDIFCIFCRSGCEGGKDVEVIEVEEVEETEEANFSLTYSGTFLHCSNICLIILLGWPLMIKGGLQNLQVAIKCYFSFFRSSDLWKNSQTRLVKRDILKNKKIKQEFNKKKESFLFI